MAGVPAPALRSAVLRYKPYHLVGPPGVHRGLPSSTLTLVISLAGPVDVRGLAVGGCGPLRAFVAGLHARPAQIHHDGSQFGVQIDVTPLGARRILGMPAGELASSVVCLDDIFGTGAALLVERLDCATSWSERFCVLDQVLQARLSDNGAAHPAVAAAWAALAQARRSLTVSDLAAETGYSRRHLTDLFGRELGLSPQVVSRVMRFERSRALLSQEGHSPLAAVAATTGYYDQAHMAREWRALAGCPPTAWINEDLPSVQDTAPSGRHHRSCEHFIRP